MTRVFFVGKRYFKRYWSFSIQFLDRIHPKRSDISSVLRRFLKGLVLIKRYVRIRYVDSLDCRRVDLEKRPWSQAIFSATSSYFCHQKGIFGLLICSLATSVWPKFPTQPQPPGHATKLVENNTASPFTACLQGNHGPATLSNTLPQLLIASSLLESDR